ncbi:MAG: hypothetical protein ACI8SA_002729 [Dokdonia sp.]|jgi:hypothetical protein
MVGISSTFNNKNVATNNMDTFKTNLDVLNSSFSFINLIEDIVLIVFILYL